MKGVPTNLGINSTEGIGSFHRVVMWYEDTFLFAGQGAGWQLQLFKSRGDLIGLPAGKSCLCYCGMRMFGETRRQLGPEIRHQDIKCSYFNRSISECPLVDHKHKWAVLYCKVLHAYKCMHTCKHTSTYFIVHIVLKQSRGLFEN